MDGKAPQRPYLERSTPKSKAAIVQDKSFIVDTYRIKLALSQTTGIGGRRFLSEKLNKIANAQFFEYTGPGHRTSPPADPQVFISAVFNVNDDRLEY